MPRKHKVMVVGAGSWGTALAVHLAQHHDSVFLWARNHEHVTEMAEARINSRYLPDIHLPDSLTVTTSLSHLQTCDTVLLAVPSHAFSNVLTQIQPYLQHRPCIVWAIKGFDDAKLLSEQFRHFFPEQPFSILAGPSFAKEVAKGLPTAITLASSSRITAEQVAPRFHFGNFRVYTSTDVIGAQLGGTVKNVIAVAAGIADGLGFGSNATSALITRGLHEITQLGLRAGARQDTFMGLSGLGDLVLTCTDNQSRNRRFGLLLGQGNTVEQAKAQINQTIESLSTLEQLPRYAEQFDVDMPITQVTSAIVKGDISPEEGVTLLLQRSAKSEQTI